MQRHVYWHRHHAQSAPTLLTPGTRSVTADCPPGEDLPVTVCCCALLSLRVLSVLVIVEWCALPDQGCLPHPQGAYHDLPSTTPLRDCAGLLSGESESQEAESLNYHLDRFSEFGSFGSALRGPDAPHRPPSLFASSHARQTTPLRHSCRESTRVSVSLDTRRAPVVAFLLVTFPSRCLAPAPAKAGVRLPIGFIGLPGSGEGAS